MIMTFIIGLLILLGIFISVFIPGLIINKLIKGDWFLPFWFKKNYYSHDLIHVLISGLLFWAVLTFIYGIGYVYVYAS